MTRCVLDASVLIKWFKPDNEAHVPEARELLNAYSQGQLVITAPHLVFLELLNSAVRRWRWDAQAVAALASRLERLRFELLEPDLAGVAKWASAGLTADDACYVALADQLNTFVVTEDHQVLQAAGAYARPIGAALNG